MRDLAHLAASCRQRGEDGGAYEIDDGTCCLVVIASWGLGWDHVSVHAWDKRLACARTPTWAQMCKVKALFFREDECAVQYHPVKADYVNFHQHTLHLWRPQQGAFPMPPRICV